MVCEAGESFPVFWVQGGGSLDFYAPCFSSSGNDYVHFYLVLVTIVPEPEVLIGPGSLRDKLLNHE